MSTLLLLSDEEIAVMTPAELEEYEQTLVAEGASPTNWRAQARPAQLPPDEDWQTFFLRGGRGSGKSWAGAHTFAEMIRDDPVRESEGPGEWAVVAPTFGDAKTKCIESDESGLLMALGTSTAEVLAKRSPVVSKWNRSMGELELRDGTMIYIDGADDGAYRIQGYNLRGAWCDEVGLWKRWKDAWDESLGFALRKGQARRVATGTPKHNQPARALIKRLLGDPEVVSRRLRTAENIENLTPAFLAQLARYKGTRLGKQELEGVLLEDAEGALWKSAWLAEHRVDELPDPVGEWQGLPVVGVDPADGNADGAEHAYTVVGLGLDHRLYVVENEGMRCSPTSFAKKAIEAAVRHGGRIVVEKNHGGEWLMTVFRRAMRDLNVVVPMEAVTASKGKRTRAEPASALYETGQVSHVGEHPELEDQMTSFTGDPKEESPDRLDSAVWALSKFTGHSFKPAASDEVQRYSSEPVPGVVRWG